MNKYLSSQDCIQMLDLLSPLDVGVLSQRSLPLRRTCEDRRSRFRAFLVSESRVEKTYSVMPVFARTFIYHFPLSQGYLYSNCIFHWHPVGGATVMTRTETYFERISAFLQTIGWMRVINIVPLKLSLDMSWKFWTCILFLSYITANYNDELVESFSWAFQLALRSFLLRSSSCQEYIDILLEWFVGGRALL